MRFIATLGALLTITSAAVLAAPLAVSDTSVHARRDDFSPMSRREASETVNTGDSPRLDKRVYITKERGVDPVNTADPLKAHETQEPHTLPEGHQLPPHFKSQKAPNPVDAPQGGNERRPLTIDEVKLANELLNQKGLNAWRGKE
ncbi:hypothetical protein EIP91_000361 [Steccherinum ochraceum]|uniref:Uncharacterized protein n=1 Tax=Steccherinum ochraceum TaxID=92696 RepID=A0A4R0RJD6_9APHY|nr:hypothetical protein EIP91_000361 [Steccherinum ochraceum]